MLQALVEAGFCVKYPVCFPLFLSMLKKHSCKEGCTLLGFVFFFLYLVARFIFMNFIADGGILDQVQNLGMIRKGWLMESGDDSQTIL